MSNFVHAPLLWGMLLVGIPVLIHLINLWRQRRVRWAAMEFLLESQRKNRRWILLRQLLLLLLRMSAVAILVLALAQPVIQDEWGALVGGGTLHHVVLLDDSYSMGDRWEGRTAFDRAKEAVVRLGHSLAGSGLPQHFTLISYSEASLRREGTQPELYHENVDSNFVSRLEATLARASPRDLATETLFALHGVKSLLAETQADETRLVYVFSDFRQRDWRDASVVASAFRELGQPRDRFYLVDCVDRRRPNLTVAHLRPTSGTIAAGVPFMMELAVVNHGETAVRNVPVQLREDGQSRVSLAIEEIGPGQSAVQTFPVQFAAAGWHTLEAELEPDAIEVDNRGRAALPVPAELPVLVITDEGGRSDAAFLITALAPGGTAETGLRPRVEPPRALATRNLQEFAAIYLVDVPSLDQDAAKALEEYLEAGGGVAFFLGPSTNTGEFAATLYRNGSGIFPVPLDRPAEPLVDRRERTGDMRVREHPLFRVFAGQRNSFLDAVRVEKYFALPMDWAPPPDGRVRVIATVRNGAPLILESNYGPGRVLTFLTTLGPRWNNWARGNPSFVVTMHELQGYLAAPRLGLPELLAGTPWTLRLSPLIYDRRVSLVRPGAAPGEALKLTASLDQDALIVQWPETDTAGVYEARLLTTTGEEESRLFACHVDPAEGNLELADRRDISNRLEDIRFSWERVETFRHSASELAGFNLGASLLVFLVCLLLGEQILAYFASYHTKAGGKP